MARVYIEGGSQYQNVTPPTRTVTEKVKTGTVPAFSFFGIPFGQKPVYSEVQKEVPGYTPYSNYGVNDTGRTLSPNPNPTSSNYHSVGKPTTGPDWAASVPSQQYGAANGQGSDSPFMGLLARLFGGKQQEDQPYEAALRERPQDIQNLVSMSRRPGFGQGS